MDPHCLVSLSKPLGEGLEQGVGQEQWPTAAGHQRERFIWSFGDHVIKLYIL